MSVLLGINIDHIATLRNARGTSYPDPVQGAFIAEQAGADSITVHLREDRRHITDSDVFLLRKTIQTSMNLEIAATEEMVDIASNLKPDFCCLVPENRCEITTESGLDIMSNRDKLAEIIVKLQSLGIDVSLFLDVDKENIAIARDLGVSCIELHTGRYAVKNNMIDMSEFNYIKQCVEYAVSCGLRVNAGHGLNYHNIRLLVSRLPIHMLHVGHAVVSRAVFYGLFAAVKDMKDLITVNNYN